MKTGVLTVIFRDIDIVFKKIQDGLHEFNYHYERYESINAEDDSDNQREKEKLENDLKKEIKRLQKFREQIKIWQSNDYIKTLALSGNSLCNKLNENKRSIEEAMETYKDVERSSKLKTFSNQSILLSAIDQQNSLNRDTDYEEDSDNFEDMDLEEFLSEIEEDELEDQLPVEFIDSIKFIKNIIKQLNKQSQKFNHEYEKLSNKKLRKNNLSVIEAKKEKITQTLLQHKFYIKRLLKIIKLMKNLKFNEINLFNLIKDDLVKYVDTNENYDPSLFDDILNSINHDDDYSEINDSEILSNDNNINSNPTNILNNQIESAHVEPTNSHSSSSQNPPQMNGHSYRDSQQSNSNDHSNNNSNSKHNINTNNIDFTSHSLQKSSTSSPIPSSPEAESPAIIKSLKPASTPSKPVGNLKWSTAAAVGISEPSQDGNFAISSNSDEVNGHLDLLLTPPSSTSNSIPNEQDINDPNYSYVEVLRNSSLSPIEINLFSDLNLVKIPPGIQDLIISFTAKRNNCENNKLIYDPKSYNQFVTPIRKPYLPQQVQPSLLKPSNFKIPIQFIKLQSYWNKIRTNNQFDQFLLEIETLLDQSNIDNTSLANELSLVLFYGYYYGLTPIENLLAESCLFKLGWKPYKTKTNGSTVLHSQLASIIEQNNNSFLYWFKQIKLISSNNEDQTNIIEFGDYHVFDLSSWEFYIKYGFKFDYKFCQLEPSKAFC